ncbi:hypothetical protein Tco_1448994 [Tanacetum coccineum]
MSQPQHTSQALQSIIDIGFETRPPMLEKGSHIQWLSRFMRYIEGNNDIGKLLMTSINKVPYEMKKMMDLGNPNVIPPKAPFERLQTEADLKNDERMQYEADAYAMNCILLAILNSIYTSVDSCKNIIAMESLKSYYHWFSKIKNDHERHNILPMTIASNTKFLNCLQPEWKRYVTIVMKTSKLHDIHFDQLYEYIEQNKEEAKVVRAERVSKHHDLLELVAHAYTAP